MKKYYKTAFASAIAASMLCSSVYASPAFKTVGELCSCLLNTANGNLKTGYEQPGTINSTNEWHAAIDAATANLTESITLNIKDFSESVYNINTIADYDISVSAEGVIKGDTAAITYTFSYSPNYRIVAAYNDKSLMPVLTGEELAALMKAQEIHDSIITPDMSYYERELTIHNYLAANYRYDIEAATNPNANNVRTHSITGLLLDGKGVCEAYSNAFMLLCRMSGIKCYLATGELDGVRHQWNIVELNGEYYNVDLTSDDPVPDEPGKIYYNYLNLSDAEISKTHRLDSSNIKCSGLRFNYYSYNNLVVSNREDLLILLNDKLNRGIREITFKTEGGYILYDAEDIKAAAEDRGLTSVSVVGDYGKEGIFTVTFK